MNMVKSIDSLDNGPLSLPEANSEQDSIMEFASGVATLPAVLVGCSLIFKVVTHCKFSVANTFSGHLRASRSD